MDERAGYFDWLTQRTGFGLGSRPSLLLLLARLDNALYFSALRGDEDRAEDGLALRQIYAAETGMPAPEGPCTVLEMMIGFAVRIDEWLNGGTEFGRRMWLYTMLRNLGLDGYDDDRMLGEAEAGETVDAILERWLSRRYAPSGQGGLFPLRGDPRDQRTVTLWYQLQGYLIENFALIGLDEDNGN